MIRRTRVRKQSEKGKLVRECDKLVWELVKARDKRCLRCAGMTALTPFHILPKGTYPRLRHELINVICVCWPCHRHHWHDNPVEGVEWLERVLPGRMGQLRVLAAVAPRVDLKILQIGLEREVEELRARA